MGTRGRRLVEARFDRRLQAEQLEQLFLQVIRRPEGSAA
jgi:hypothetical protein